MNLHRQLTLALLAGLLPFATQASPSPGVRDEIRTEMADARREVRVELAQARAELDSENLSLGDGLHFGKSSARKQAVKATLPKAEISPRGEFLLEGRAVAIDARQRAQLLDYRAQVIGMAKLGIDAGEQAAMAALDATDVSLFSLVVGGMTGSLERRIESTVKRHIEPMVRQICQRLPRAYDAQQRLAASLPQFRPYATLGQDDIEDCERDMRNELASR